MPRLTLLCSIALGMGCTIGSSVDRYPPAKGPGGTTAEFQLVSGRIIAGELVEVRDTAFLLDADGLLTIAPFFAISRANFDDARFASYRGRAGPGRRVLEQLRAFARYPSGVTPELLSRILEAYDQEHLAVLEP